MQYPESEISDLKEAVDFSAFLVKKGLEEVL